MDILTVAQNIVKVLSDKKGLNIKLIKISDVSVVADYMVLCTGNSSTHVKALSDEVEYKLKNLGVPVNHIEGHRSNSWVLLDYLDVVVHIFSNEAREFYNLDRLWEDGEEIDIYEYID